MKRTPVVRAPFEAPKGKWTIEFYSGKCMEIDGQVLEGFLDPAEPVKFDFIRLYITDGSAIIIPRESIAIITFKPTEGVNNGIRNSD